jgi:hypothetical protein
MAGDAGTAIVTANSEQMPATIPSLRVLCFANRTLLSCLPLFVLPPAPSRTGYFTFDSQKRCQRLLRASGQRDDIIRVGRGGDWEITGNGVDECSDIAGIKDTADFQIGYRTINHYGVIGVSVQGSRPGI